MFDYSDNGKLYLKLNKNDNIHKSKVQEIKNMFDVYLYELSFVLLIVHWIIVLGINSVDMKSIISS